MTRSHTAIPVEMEGRGTGASPEALKQYLGEMEPLVAEVAAYAEALVLVSDSPDSCRNTISVLSAEMNRRMARVGGLHAACWLVATGGPGRAP